MSEPDGWFAVLEVRCADAAAADRLYRVLAPEASREVPRTRAELRPPEAERLSVRVEARDTGALRAAVQTYLGWVQLTAATERAGAPG